MSYFSIFVIPYSPKQVCFTPTFLSFMPAWNGNNVYEVCYSITFLDQYKPIFRFFRHKFLHGFQTSSCFPAQTVQVTLHVHQYVLKQRQHIGYYKVVSFTSPVAALIHIYFVFTLL